MCFLMKNGAEEEVICTVSFRILLAFGDTVGTNDPQTLFSACRGEIERAASQNTTALPESSTKFWTSAGATCEPWSRPLRGGGPGPGSLWVEQTLNRNIRATIANLELPSSRSPHI
jgi:hypothetical protein